MKFTKEVTPTENQTKEHQSNPSNLVTLIVQRIRNIGISLVKDGAIVHWLGRISTIIFCSLYVLQFKAILSAKDDRLFECISEMTFCGMGILKLISLYRNHKHWNFLINAVSELEKEELSNEESFDKYEKDDDVEFTFSYHIVSYTAEFKTVSTVLARIYGFTAIIYVLSPFLEYGFLKDTREDGWPHILPIWPPFDHLSFSGYLFTILLEFIAAVFCVFVHVAFDLTAVGFMIFICGQFVLLRQYSQSIGGNGRQLQLSRKRDERAHHRIARCHKIYERLMIASHVLSTLLKNILGVYFFVATVTLCSVAIRLNSYQEMSSMQLVSLAQYMCATLTQLFLFCYYGDNILEKSSVNQGEGPFGAAHWCLSPQVREELAMLGLGMMMPRHFYAGPFTSLDLPSFIQVVKTAYSYYAVIRN
uniref:Odorant receptor n=1 Tax=Glyphodes pyloalis TaxID=1242752 RepID=A0A6M3GU55_GLYPY|nr:olfactory receptor [Glyphodes pyloalis]